MMKKASSLDSCWRLARTSQTSFKDPSSDPYRPLLHLDPGLPLLPADNDGSCPLVTNECCKVPSSKHDGRERVHDSWEPICGNHTSGLHGNDVSRFKEDDSGNNSLSGAGSMDGESVGGRTRSSSSNSKSESDIEMTIPLESHGECALGRNAEACENDDSSLYDRKKCDTDLDHDLEDHHLSPIGTELHFNNEHILVNQNVSNQEGACDAGSSRHLPTTHPLGESNQYAFSQPFNDKHHTRVDETRKVHLNAFPCSISSLCSSHSSSPPVNVPVNSHDTREVNSASVNSTHPASTSLTSCALSSNTLTSSLPDHGYQYAIPHEAYYSQPQSYHTTMCSGSYFDSLPPIQAINSPPLCYSHHYKYLPSSTVATGQFNTNGIMFPNSIQNRNNAYNGNHNNRVHSADQVVRTQEINNSQTENSQQNRENSSDYLTPQHTQWNNDCSPDPVTGFAGNMQHLQQVQNSNPPQPTTHVRSQMPQNASFSQSPNELQTKLQEMKVNGISHVPSPNMAVNVPTKRNNTRKSTIVDPSHANNSRIFNIGLPPKYTLSPMEYSGNKDYQPIPSHYYINPSSMHATVGPTFSNGRGPQNNLHSSVPSNQPYEMLMRPLITHHEHQFQYGQEPAPSRQVYQVLPNTPEPLHDSLAPAPPSHYSHQSHTNPQHSSNVNTLGPSCVSYPNHSYSPTAGSFDQTQSQTHNSGDPDKRNGSSGHSCNPTGGSDHPHIQHGSSDPIQHPADSSDQVHKPTESSDHSHTQANSSVPSTTRQTTQNLNQACGPNDEITTIPTVTHQSADALGEIALPCANFPEAAPNRIPERGCDDDLIPMIPMDHNRRSEDADTPVLGQLGSTNSTEGQSNYLIDERYSPDYKPFCIVAFFFNPIFGMLALLANMRSKHHFQHQHFKTATNYHVFTILLCSLSIFTTITIGFMLFTNYEILKSCEEISTRTAKMCPGNHLGLDEELRKYYNLDSHSYCQLLHNSNVMEALKHYYTLHQGIFASHRDRKNKKAADIPTEADRKTNEIPKFAPPLPGGAATSNAIKGKENENTKGSPNKRHNNNQNTADATTFKGLSDESTTPHLLNDTLTGTYNSLVSNNTLPAT